MNTKTCHFGGLGTPFWFPGTPFWHQLVSKGCPGTSRMAPWGPLMDFLWFLIDFGILLGTSFWSISEYFLDLGCEMDGMDASVDFLVIRGWNSCQNWMLGCAGTIQKTMVFVIFHFFNIFMILVSPGGSWDLILEGLGSLGAPLW